VRRDALALGLILGAVVLLYAHVSGAAFCGYDDFNESYRAAFFDAKVPSRIVTATHFTGFMYRPVTSALQLATWQFFDHSPLAFRLRNLAMHLIAIAFVYGITLLLGGSRLSAAGAALLFGLSPYANEAVVVAIWTNTTAYALLLGSFFAFLLALRRFDAGAGWIALLVTSLGLALVALFTYEPTIVVFGLIILYLAFCRRERVPGRAFLQALALGSAIDFAFFFIVRHVVHAGSAALLPFGEIVHNTALYIGGLLVPVDPVLANTLFGTPLPASGEPVRPAALLPAIVAAGVLVCAFAAGLARPVGDRLRNAPWATLGFLIVSIPMTLVPIVLYRAHVSEFNLYVPSALYAIALALLLEHFCRNRVAFEAVVGLLLLSYTAGTVVRNERVVACAHVASKIVASLPTGAWERGPWYVRVATAPNEVLSTRFGIYNYSGIETIEVPETTIKGTQEALRLTTGNVRVRAAVVPATALGRDCSDERPCFYVYPNGDVKAVKEVSGR
jgi:hypothetical protein